ncbi:MAG TPA: LLM class flavin-dependent oxidoreductase [Thermoanaerobaculia bacterium]
MVPLSVLDLAPVVQGGTVAQSLHNTLSLARHVERLGFRRYWVAEHHNLPGVASAATAVVLAHVAGGTRTIRVGAGGVMLPNHAPLVIAEQFGTLASLFPDRIDLGLGRAPGSDGLTARALRRTLATDADAFPQDVLELLAYLAPAQEGQRIRAVPGEGTNVPVWILGSSLFGADLAALLGLPYAFASHFAPGQLEPALALYRDRFRPSPQLAKPYAMAGLNVFAAESDDQAERLATSVQQAFVNLRFGTPSTLPPPRPGYLDTLSPIERATIEHALECTVVGDPETVRRGLAAFVARTGVDEVIVACQMFDHNARLRSYEILAEAAGLTNGPERVDGRSSPS